MCGEAEELGEADVSGEDEEFADGCSEEESENTSDETVYYTEQYC